MSDPKPRPLTPKQRRFVEEYMVDRNQTQAALRAGYAKRSARQSGSDNMKNPYILEEVIEELDRLSEITGVTAEEVIRGLHEEATDKSEGSKHSARVSAWSWLGKYFKLFTERVEHIGSVEVKVTEVTLEYPEEEETEG